MANALANASDWYLDLLNRLHILPANAATLLRSISAKQFGDRNFRPRPLTDRHFTDAELDALLRLAADGKGGYRTITNSSYDRIYPKDTYDEDGRRSIPKGGHGDETLSVGGYLAPARVVATSLGQAAVKPQGKDHVLTDTYDFNHGYASFIRTEDGKFDTDWGSTYDNEKTLIRDAIRKGELVLSRKNTPYGKLRSNALRLAHNDTDPDEGKIKAKISFNAAKKRLGSRLGKMDIMSAPDRKSILLRGIAAGGLTGAPIGAAAGLTAGLIRLLDSDNRKRWRRTLLNSTLAGAGILGLAGAAGGGLLAHGIDRKFGKSAAADQKDEKSRRRRRLAVNVLATAVPLAALAGLGYGAYRKGRPILDGLRENVNHENEILPKIS